MILSMKGDRRISLYFLSFTKQSISAVTKQGVASFTESQPALLQISRRSPHCTVTNSVRKERIFGFASLLQIRGDLKQS